jgi:hypothetical protein
MAISRHAKQSYIRCMKVRSTAGACLLAGSLFACSHPHDALHIRDTPADYLQLGLTETVVPREDGRRTRAGSDDYEWWYLDGVAKDGTLIVAVFSDNWLPGKHRRGVSIDVTPPGQPTRKARFVTDQAGSFSSERADVRIGRSRFSGDLEHYTISVDPGEGQGIGCQLQLTRRVPSYRPATGVIASGEDFFAWVVAVPEGELAGTVTLDGRTLPFAGSGYHDHNWGNVPPWDLMRNWWWGRAEVNGQTVVMSDMRPAKGRGDKPISLLYIAGPNGATTRLHGDAARLVEGPAAPSNDPRHPENRASFVRLQGAQPTNGTTARFDRQGAPTTSIDLLAERSRFVRWLAHVSGRSPWYTRWRSVVTIDKDGTAQRGDGTIEFMSFE